MVTDHLGYIRIVYGLQYSWLDPTVSRASSGALNIDKDCPKGVTWASWGVVKPRTITFLINRRVDWQKDVREFAGRIYLKNGTDGGLLSYRWLWFGLNTGMRYAIIKKKVISKLKRSPLKGVSQNIFVTGYLYM